MRGLIFCGKHLYALEFEGDLFQNEMECVWFRFSVSMPKNRLNC